MTSAPQNGLPADGKSRNASERIGTWVRWGRDGPHPPELSERTAGAEHAGRAGASRGKPESAERFRKKPRGSGKCRRAGQSAEGAGAVRAGRLFPLSSGVSSLGHEKNTR